ncbi:MAG: aminotransferase class IV [Bacillota bacterium]|nr:aminotransferase class IV [Bacillota bacterium]
MPYPIIDALAGSHIAVDGQLIAVDAPEAGPLYQPQDARMYYEVIRVVQGVPLFLEDHLQRLKRSVAGAFTLPAMLEQESRDLIRANSLNEANLRLILTDKTRVMHLTPSYYPDVRTIEQGVVTGILAWERQDPNTKIIHADYKAAVADRFARPGPFGPCTELLLTDRHGYLTEGSRSNLFFIKGKNVISAPDDRILLGITRRYVSQAIRDADLELAIDLLTLDDIRSRGIQTSFISGSPIDLLPIRAIEDLAQTSADDPAFRRLYTVYMQIVQDYVERHR